MRWTKVVALATTGVFALAACGGGGGSSNTGTGNQNADNEFAKVPASAALQPDVKGPAPMPAGAKKGGTLTLNVDSVPEHLDPSTQYFSDTATILRLTARALTQYKMQGGKSVLVPDLATNLGEKSKDGMSWKYTLKKGLKYEDGTPIKASDVEYSVKRSFAQEEMPAGPTFQVEYLKGGDKYKGPWKQPGADMPGIQADDAAGTITFNLSKKMETFPYFASFSMFGGIPEKFDKAKPAGSAKYLDRGFATGPYKMQQYRKGSLLTLVRNTNWDPASDPSRNQLPDTITFNFGRDAATTAKSIMANNGPDQTTLSYDGVHSSIVAQAPSKKNQIAVGADPCTRWPGATMDTRRIPLEVRRAIQVAWPTNAIRVARSLTSYDVSPGTTIAVPQVPGFKALPANGQPTSQNGDPVKARQMLQQAGKLGFELSYYYINDDNDTKKEQQVKQPLLEKAGFKVKAVGVPEADYRKKIKDAKAPTNMGNGVATGWCYDWPAGDSIYPPLFLSTLPISGGVGNVKDPKLDAQLRRVAGLPIEQQGPEWSKIDKQIRETIVPVVTMFYSKAASIFGTKVHNVQVDPNQGMPTIANVWVG